MGSTENQALGVNRMHKCSASHFWFVTNYIAVNEDWYFQDNSTCGLAIKKVTQYSFIEGEAPEVIPSRERPSIVEIVLQLVLFYAATGPRTLNREQIGWIQKSWDIVQLDLRI